MLRWRQIISKLSCIIPSYIIKKHGKLIYILKRLIERWVIINKSKTSEMLEEQAKTEWMAACTYNGSKKFLCFKWTVFLFCEYKLHWSNFINKIWKMKEKILCAMTPFFIEEEKCCQLQQLLLLIWTHFLWDFIVWSRRHINGILFHLFFCISCYKSLKLVSWEISEL